MSFFGGGILEEVLVDEGNVKARPCGEEKSVNGLGQCGDDGAPGAEVKVSGKVSFGFHVVQAVNLSGCRR